MADGQLFPSDEDTQILNTVNIPQIDQQITVAEGKIILTQLLFQLFNGIILAVFADSRVVQTVMPADFHIIDLGRENTHNTGLSLQDDGLIILLIQLFDSSGKAQGKVKIIDWLSLIAK